METMKILEKAREKAENLIKEITKKENISTSELEIVEKCVCLIKSIKEIENADNMIQRSYEGYSGRRYYDGSFSRNMNHYSGHSKRDRMISALEEMYDNAQNEHERQFVQEWLARIDYRN